MALVGFSCVLDHYIGGLGFIGKYVNLQYLLLNYSKYVVYASQCMFQLLSLDGPMLSVKKHGHQVMPSLLGQNKLFCHDS